MLTLAFSSKQHCVNKYKMCPQTSKMTIQREHEFKSYLNAQEQTVEHLINKINNKKEDNIIYNSMIKITRPIKRFFFKE